ncbi:MAG: type I methionyl aminopeptidase [Candidatus Marinimicrobia bacterium]|jgi:methionyl aminopeptidase|nr:type I methionyl aminopeptidase [Candidatus Neomarinimicrobiota bacterium]|tara:strand:- start:217 stop:996 length:780 start_codon:yes stop_codon:yes gene_type:complete
MVRIRTKREIQLIAESCQIVADTLEMLSAEMVPGKSILELDRMAEDYIRNQNARPAFKGYRGYPSTLCVSVDDEVVHGIPNERILQEGQIVGVDCGAEKMGYYGDHARTFAIGEISEEKRKLMEVTQESLMRGIQSAQVGNHVSDIGYTIQSYVESFGYSVVRELVGHGIGTQLHEEPQIPNYGVPGQGYKLQEGMCIAIEPMINLGVKEIITDTDGWTIRTADGKSSAHFEHTITITSGEAVILSEKSGKDELIFVNQ